MIEKIISLVLDDAQRMKEAAGFAGEFGDRGASIMEAQVKFYRHGQEGTIPSEWLKYKQELDPEYQDYLRLKKKFG